MAALSQEFENDECSTALCQAAAVLQPEREQLYQLLCVSLLWRHSHLHALPKIHKKSVPEATLITDSAEVWWAANKHPTWACAALPSWLAQPLFDAFQHMHYQATALHGCGQECACQRCSSSLLLLKDLSKGFGDSRQASSFV